MNQILKKLVLLICVGGILTPFAACSDYLDVSKEIADNLTTEQVFNNPGYTKRWYSNIYNCITEFSETGSGASDGFSGVWCIYAGEVTTSASDLSSVMVSGFNAGNAPNHRWGALYQRIRQAMIFINNAKPLGGSDDQTQLTESDINQMKTEAKFLIAYSYFSLFELYGPVPIVDEIADPSNQNLDYARVPVDKFIKYIDDLLKEVIDSEYLPETLSSENGQYNLNEIVRPTKVAAMALRAKLWVYAASPVFNGKYEEALTVKNKDGEPLYSAYDAGKWGTAKKHLENLFDFAEGKGHKLYYAKPDAEGVVDPNQSVYELFQYYNDEILWATGENTYGSASMENKSNPRDLYNGWSNISASQNVVDAFFCKDGLDIHESDLYKEDGFSDVVNVCNENKRLDKQICNMFVNREPRFYSAVIYEGKSWHIQPTNKPNYTVLFAKGEPNDNSKQEHPRTGYLLGKFKNRKLLNTGNYVKKWGRPSILLRLADFYLYYAEVCNEIDPGDPNVIKYLDLVRVRAGIPGYKELAATGKKNIIGNQVLQRKAIQHERQVELYAEGQRYFDTRRWMICGEGEDADQSVLLGLNMNGKSNVPIGDPNSFFTRVVLENRSWRRAMYLYPIPLNEIQKSRLLVQNPLW